MEIYEKIRYYREHTDNSQRNVAKILGVPVFYDFFLLYHNRLTCTLHGENLYTYWRIPVHSFWRVSVCFIILLTTCGQRKSKNVV